MHPNGAGGDDAPNLQALFRLRNSIANDDVIHPGTVQLRDGSHQPPDDLDRQVVRPREPESTLLRLRDRRSVTGDDVSVLHSQMILSVHKNNQIGSK